MPGWKPDCLKASSTLNHLSSTIETARFINDDHENNSISNESTSIKSNNLQDANHHKNKKLDLSHSTKPLSFQNASSKLSIQKGYSSVELTRSNSSQFGLTIAGGTDKDSRPRICDLKPGSIAHRCDELQIGDMIISINGIKTQGLKHEEIIDLIKNAGDALCLEFEYNLPPWPIHPHHAVRSQTVHIQLEKESSSYGFTIRGGYNEDKIKSRPLIVTNIRAGGPSDREGTLKIGDRIIAINGINIINATLQDAYFILKQCKGLTLFLVEYDSAIVDSIKNSNGPLLIEIEKSPGSSIGIKLTSGKNPNDGKNQILVESVKPASIADRCGAIYAGDQILSIDDVSFEHVTLAEANQILKNCVGEFSRVEILPLSQLHSATKANNQQKSSSKSLVDLNKEYRLVDMQKFGSLNSCSTSLNTNQVCHPEKVEINLRADESGTFGFTLQGASNHAPNHDLVQSVPLYPVIGYVEPNSVAERCGILQPGDRIMSVNKNHLEGLSLEDARQIIKDAGANLNLEIEFDVADTVILSSGIFQVKLLKKNLDLGISVAYSKFTKTDNYPVISTIKKGSVAYRSGMLQPGDQILYIDNTCLKNKSLDEIKQMLKGNEEIVKLKIKKDENNTEEAIDEKTVVYTVEMEKNGGPLGITISGSDDLFEPMFVSGLTEGGLAERTNAIHIGDVILAINNVSLKGKSLIEAIDLLKNAGDMVTLKISRKIDNQQQQHNHQSHQIPMQHEGYHDNFSQQKLINTNNNRLSNQPVLVKNSIARNHYDQEKSSTDSSRYSLQNSSNGHCVNGNGFSRNGNEKINENSDFINNEYQKSLQYLPFPMDMTNFIKESPTNKPTNTNNNNINNGNNKYLSNNLNNISTTSSNASSSSSNISTTNTSSNSSNTNSNPQNINNNNNNNNSTNNIHLLTNNNNNNTNYNTNNNHVAPKIINHHHQQYNNHHNYSIEDCNIKKKAASIDSINAVERELDEVLKDLELNSQDLNDHLDDNDYNQIKNIIELPITIQKNIKIEQCSSNGHSNNTSSPLFNKSSQYAMHNHVNQPNNTPHHLKWNNYIDSNLNHNRIVNSSYGQKISGTATPPPQMNSDFSGTRPNFCELYIDDSNENELSNDNDCNNFGKKPTNNNNHIHNHNNKLSNGSIGLVSSNDNRKRQNIISTYELCHECFDNNSLLLSNNNKQMTNSIRSTSNNSMQLTNGAKCCANRTTPNSTGIKSMQNINEIVTVNNKALSPTNGLVGNNSSAYSYQNGISSNHCSSPIKMTASNSNHEIMHNSAKVSSNHNHLNNDSNSVLVNSSPNHGENNGASKQANKYPSNNSNNNSELSEVKANLNNNGHVISQKVISIGLPNGSRTDDHLNNAPETKSFNSKNEEKLDRLPPVPPSAWSANSSIKRRNQYYQNNFQSAPSSITNNRLKKFNVMNNGNNNTTNKSNMNDSQQQSDTQQQQQPSHYQQYHQNHQQVNGHVIKTSDSSTETPNEIKQNGNNDNSNNNGNIDEPSTGEISQDQNRGSNQGYNLKNYDNLNVSNKASNQINNLNNTSIDNPSVDDKIEISISRDDRYQDFGFTLAKSLHGNGIYVDKIRMGSPAESHLYLKPNTKVFKINNYDCTKIEITQANKILASESSTCQTLKLIISTMPKNIVLNNNVDKDKLASIDDKITSSSIENAHSLASCKATAL